MVISALDERSTSTAARIGRFLAAAAPYVLAGGAGLSLATNEFYVGGGLVAAAVAVVTLVMLSLRHRWPLAITLICALATMVSAAALGPLVVAIASLATRRRRREIAVLVGGLAVLTVIGTVVGSTSVFFSLVNVVLDVVCVAAVIAIGLYVGTRRDLIAHLRRRAEEAEAEQVGLAERARQAERSRIAREMHDVLAHRVSRVAMHAGALAYRDNLSAAQVRESASYIQADANAALIELREVLGVLREPSASGVLLTPRPQPTWADIADLVLEADSGSRRVSLTDEVRRPERINTLLGRTAYRIVQESLTNAGKHAPAARVEVALTDEGEAALQVWVRNLLPVGATSSAPPGSGFGLVGVAERVTLLHGRMTYGVVDRQFVVHATLPLTDADA